MRASHRLRTTPALKPFGTKAATKAPRTAAELSSLQDLSLTAMLGLQFAMLFVATPVAALGYVAGRYSAEALVIAFIVLVIVVSRSPVAMWVAIVGVAASLVGTSWDLALPSKASGMLMHGGSEIGIAACGYIIARAIFAPGPVTLHRVLGAIVFYLNGALWFATTYRVVHDLVPGAFNGLAADAGEAVSFPALIYFSLVTLTSTGYGDISPLHPVARSVANIESIFGQLYPATLIAVLVTQHLELRRRSGAKRVSE